MEVADFWMEENGMFFPLLDSPPVAGGSLGKRKHPPIAQASGLFVPIPDAKVLFCAASLQKRTGQRPVFYPPRSSVLQRDSSMSVGTKLLLSWQKSPSNLSIIDDQLVCAKIDLLDGSSMKVS